MLKDGFEKADKFLEKEQKNREKWEKEQEKKKKTKKSSKKKKDDDDDDKKDDKGDSMAAADDKKKDDKESDEYTPLPRDDTAQPFLDLRDKKLRALVSISRSGDYKHFIDAKGDEEFEWDLRVPMTTSLDIFHVMDDIVETGARVVMEPRITLHPGTMRQRNLLAEFDQAGGKLVLIPRADRITSFETWLQDVGEVVAAGLDRQTALRAMTLEPAGLLGLDEQLGSIEVGKTANLVIVNGDPFETATEVKAVMIDGEFVFDEVTK